MTECPSHKEIIKLTFTDEEGSRLQERFWAGHYMLTDPTPRPWEVDEVGQPILTRRALGEDEANMEHKARIGDAIRSLSQSGSGEGVVRCSREVASYIGTCIWLSLVNEGMVGSEIFGTNPEDHEGVAMYKRFEEASRGPGVETAEPL